MDEEQVHSKLRALPSVDALLHQPLVQSLRASLSAERLTALAREVIGELRAELLGQESSAPRSDLLVEAAARLCARVERERASSLQRRVINATGVVLHTNLGRAPLADVAVEAMARASRYCALEFDLETGKRGRRGARVERLLGELTGAEAALVVNNCAAATLLVLSALARDGEVIISRGELVEIGGDFRIPDVMAQSGATMVEVGTTNRTRLVDYERAINARTRLIARVHQSNYRIIGFTHAPSLEELASLAHAHGLFLYEDAGSGALVDLRQCGIDGEPIIRESLEKGADVVTFSGDKLLGAAQAGLIVGRRECVERLRRHPLYRALRVDKLTLAALEATLEIYRRGHHLDQVPALRMLAVTPEELERRALSLASRLRASAPKLRVEVIAGQSAVGGGAAPMASLPTSLVALEHEEHSAAEIERALRQSDPPIIARVSDEKVMLDLRTVAADEEVDLFNALLKVA